MSKTTYRALTEAEAEQVTLAAANLTAWQVMATLDAIVGQTVAALEARPSAIGKRRKPKYRGSLRTPIPTLSPAQIERLIDVQVSAWARQNDDMGLGMSAASRREYQDMLAQALGTRGRGEIIKARAEKLSELMSLFGIKGPLAIVNLIVLLFVMAEIYVPGFAVVQAGARGVGANRKYGNGVSDRLVAEVEALTKDGQKTFKEALAEVGRRQVFSPLQGLGGTISRQQFHRARQGRGHGKRPDAMPPIINAELEPDEWRDILSRFQQQNAKKIS